MIAEVIRMPAFVSPSAKMPLLTLTASINEARFATSAFAQRHLCDGSVKNCDPDHCLQRSAAPHLFFDKEIKVCNLSLRWNRQTRRRTDTPCATA